MGALRMWLALGVAVAAVGYGCHEWRAQRPIAGNVVRGAPMQDEREVRAPFDVRGYRLTPVARFEVQARVLSTERYRMGRESDLSPLDLALGWNRMSEDAVLEQLRISQGARFYTYRWERTPPIPPAEIVANSANVHVIPADAQVGARLDAARPGAVVRLRGWLVDVDGSDGWRWRTSRRRDDTGAGACEIIWVEAAEVVERLDG